MFQYNTIRLGGVWLTDSAGNGGNPYITEVTGLDKLSLTRQSVVVLAIDGTPRKQFQSNKGLPVAVKFDLIDTAQFNAIVLKYNQADDANTSISLYITGPMGVFDLNVLPVSIEGGSSAIQAGLKTLTLNFVVSAHNKNLVTALGTYAQTGNAVTLTYP